MGSAPVNIPGYEIIKKIGTGGMGRVYAARQVRLDRDVALKILSDEVGRDSSFVPRFEREVKSLAKLNHPNIVQTFDAGKVGGIYYLAMEYIEGDSLADVLHKFGPMHESYCLKLVHQLASALSHAHDHGLVHRDIKPENIFLSKTGGLKLGDFGLAKKVSFGTAEKGLTSTGITMGTPYYMSPEQIRGQDDLDGRSDLYALGATLYHMLTGSPPFDAENTADILSGHLTGTPVVPRERRGEISQDVSDMVMKLLSKRPEERFQTAGELCRYIQSLLGTGSAGKISQAALDTSKTVLVDTRTGDPRSQAQGAAAPGAATMHASSSGDCPEKILSDEIRLSDEAVCLHCGEEIDGTATHCGHCGRSRRPDPSRETPPFSLWDIRWFGGPNLFAMASIVCLSFAREYTRWVLIVSVSGLLVFAFWKKDASRSMGAKLLGSIRGELRTLHDWVMAVLGVCNFLASISSGPYRFYLSGAIGAGIVLPLCRIALAGSKTHDAGRKAERREQPGRDGRIDPPAQKEKVRPGEWQVLSAGAGAPGVAFSVLLDWIKQGRLHRTVSVRGPTTGFAWRFAEDTPKLSKHLGLCWHCHGSVKKAASLCPQCGVSLDSLVEARPKETAFASSSRGRILAVLALVLITGVIVAFAQGWVPANLHKKVYDNLLPGKSRHIREAIERIEAHMQSRRYREAGREIDALTAQGVQYTPYIGALRSLRAEQDLLYRVWNVHVKTGDNYRMNPSVEGAMQRARENYQKAIALLPEAHPDILEIRKRIAMTRDPLGGDGGS